MLRRTSSSQSTPSTLAPTNTDSISIKKLPFDKKDSFGIPLSSSDENKLQTEIISVKNPKKKNSTFSKSPSKNKPSNFSSSTGSSNSSKLIKRRKSLKVFDENKNEIYNKPILKNKNLKKILRPTFNLNVTEYKGKTIKFVDQVVDINQPLVQILKVESYRMYNQEISQMKIEGPMKKIKEESKCRCLIF